jgi:hypothetical protein
MFLNSKLRFNWDFEGFKKFDGSSNYIGGYAVSALIATNESTETC